VSSGLNSFSTVFTLDVVAQLKPMDEDATRRMGKWLTLLAAALAVGVAYMFSKSGKGFFELSQGLVSILAPPLSVVFLAGIMWKRANSKAAEIVLYGGGLVCLIVGICHVLGYPYKGFWPHFLLLSVYLFLVLAAIMVLVSLFTKPDYDRILPSLLETNRKIGHNSRKVWLGWGILASVMLFIYWIFS
jgi:SSS family solute:Na+ symporter